MNPLSRPTALLEIFIMLVGAFILGYIAHCFCGCRRCGTACSTGCADGCCAGASCGCTDSSKCTHGAKPKAVMSAVKTAVPAVAAPIAAVATTAAHAGQGTKDDLKKIEGIGPAIEKLLHAEGITTFAQVASAPAARIKGILEKAGPQFAMHDCESWAEQAVLARDGKWAEFEALLVKLVNGKRA